LKNKQTKILTKYWDEIDPNSIESYRKKGGYLALQKALRREGREIINEIKKSGLRGRGGGGFLTGKKWELAKKTKASKKYFICNLDESEPGTFKDKSLAEKNPHQIIEGIIIGAYAVRAKEAFIYLNGKFSLASELLKRAIEEAKQKGFLGRSIMGSNFDLSIEVFAGAGAYICGEESALINSLEGKRPEPRYRPPFVSVCGLKGKPTVVNNAETLANVPWIIKHGSEEYLKLGLKNCSGTKLFCIDGAVNYPGVYEAEFGITLRELIYDLAGGIIGGEEFWLAQVGGSAGQLIPQGVINETPTYDSTAKIAVGSGAVLVIDKNQEIKELMLSWIRFFQRESCGKCVPCREGTFRLKEIIRRLKEGNFTSEDKEDLEKLVWTLTNTTFCPLGKFSVRALKDVIKYKLVKELTKD